MPLSYDEFLAQCRGALSDSKYEMVKSLTLASAEGPLVAEWAKFYGVYAAELAYQRRVRLGQKAEPPYDRDEKLSKLITAAMNNDNPLQAEEMLLAAQFEKIDELIGTHYFDDAALMGYALKLKLLERKYSFKPDEGKAQLDRIIANLEQEITGMEQE
ncbi:MAG: DUF2764 family protein [Clostridia bacterium]|nr:DUF2764 family protein [Clostridia bacterium]